MSIATNFPDRLRRVAALQAVEARLAGPEDTADLYCLRAALLDSLGRTEEARRAYLAGLTKAPDHAASLNGLGALLYRTGYRTAARTTYAHAVACHPDQPLGHINLANLLRENGDLAAAQRHYETALQTLPGCPEAHQGLGNIFSELGDPARARKHWQLGYQDRVFDSWPFRGTGTPVRVLLLTSILGGNLPARSLLDDDTFAVVSVAMEFYRPSLALPPHDVVLNAIGDADLCSSALKRAAALLRRTRAPVINNPPRYCKPVALGTLAALALLPASRRRVCTGSHAESWSAPAATRR